MIYLVLFVLFLIFMPHSAYAWGPGVHIDISVSILDKINTNTASMLLANLNEYLYGALAPDFVIGKKFADDKKHTHNWDIGFQILHTAQKEREIAFAMGYLTHLASDSAAHGIMMPKMVDGYKQKGVRHFYIEAFADAYCDNSYKYLAKKILKRYNSDLDIQFKFKVDSILFSFSVSKLLFKRMSNITLNRKFENFILSRKFENLINLQRGFIENYINLSKQFSIDILENRENSKVVKISAISR